MNTWTINGFAGINNMQDQTALLQPKVTSQNGDGAGQCELLTCINFDIDDNGGLVSRDVVQPIFTKEYSAKLTQTFRGRTWYAMGSTLHYTAPFSNSVDPRRNAIQYPAAITMIQEIENGMWVSTTERVYYHKGHDPTTVGGFTQTAEYTFPAIMGTGEKLAASKLLLKTDGFVAIFATTFGVCVGDDNGILTNISEATFSYVPGQRGISLIREHGGMIQYQVKMLNDIGDSYNQQVPLTLDVDEQ